MTQRQIYNRQYYLKNRDVLLSKAKKRYKKTRKFPNNIIPLFDHIQIVPRKIINVDKWFYLIFTLCASITLFLIKETAEFYKPLAIQSYIKAILLETSVIVFTLITPKKSFKTHYTALVWAIYGYALWTLAGGPLSEFYINKSKYYDLQNEIYNFLNIQMKNINIRDHYISLNHFTKARYLTNNINKLSEAIQILKTKQNALILPSVHLNSIINSIFFRLLLMISNFFSLKELKKLKS